jgi:hypothetical protein
MTKADALALYASTARNRGLIYSKPAEEQDALLSAWREPFMEQLQAQIDGNTELIATAQARLTALQGGIE